jgi:Cu-Zn family superoxide dismutase
MSKLRKGTELGVGLSVFIALLAVPLGGQGHGAAARATLKDQKGQTIAEAELSSTSKGVLVRLRLTGAPVGAHAFHIHETGKCDPPGFDSAGGHLNPSKAAHGFHNPKGPHLGDIPNLHVPQGGSLEIEMLVEDVSLDKGNALLDGDGAALVIHQAADDYHSEPAGNAGPRVACGVIVR